MHNEYTWKNKVSCQYIDSSLELNKEHIATTMGCYMYNIVEQGECYIEYNGEKITMRKNELTFFNPTIIPELKGATDDYKAITLIIHSDFVSENIVIRKMLQTAFYIDNPHEFTSQAIHGAYSVFLADLAAILGETMGYNKSNCKNYDLFISFTELLKNNFKQHHDVAFYARQLHISPRYLSMIIKDLTNNTVIYFINRKLSLEACWLLKSSRISIQEISDALHFSDQSAFCKFFKRQIGKTPLAYRNE